MRPEPSPAMRRATRGFLQSVETSRPAAELWRALVEPQGLAGWYADVARVEPVAGGRYSVVTRPFGVREAHVDLVEPGRRLRLIYDPAPGWPPIEDGALVEDFVIDERRGRTVLRVIGSGVPAAHEWDPWLRRLQSGWAVALARLVRQLGEAQP